jgi:hypothetical protein
MAYTPEQQERLEKLRYYGAHIVPIAAVISGTFFLTRLIPVIRKALKNGRL